MARKKTIRSSALKRTLFLSRLKWFIPFIFAIGYAVYRFKEFHAQYVANPIPETLGGILMISIGYGFIYGTLPTLILFAYNKHAKKQQIKNTTIPSIVDLDYFREKLRGLSPGEISLLANLDLEVKKDLPASVLKLQSMGLLQDKGKEYVRTNKPTGKLRPSDQLILENVPKNSFGIKSTYKWIKLVQQEALEQGLIKKSTASLTARTGCLPALLFLGASGWVIHRYEHLFKQLPGLIGAEANPAKVWTVLTSNIPILLLCILVLFANFALSYLVSFPFMFAATQAGHTAHRSEFERTEKGNVIAEYIFGMKNFIHEFSALSERQKEDLVLWDDYLIYALVLEENESVVVEEMRKLRKSQRIWS